MSEIQTSPEDRIKKILTEQMFIDGVEPGSIKNDANLVYDLGFDSLDLVEIVMAVEDDFHMEISDEDGEKLLTVQQVIDYVTANAKA